MQNTKVAMAASGAGMPPKSARLTYTQLTPHRNNPKPKQKPWQAAAIGAGVARQISIKPANAIIGSGNQASGAKPATQSAPRQKLRMKDEGWSENGGWSKKAGSEEATGRPASSFIFGFLYQHGMHAPAVGVKNLEPAAVDGDGVPAFGQLAEMSDHQAADGIELLVSEAGSQRRIKVRDFGLRLHPVAVVAVGDDIVL